MNSFFKIGLIHFIGIGGIGMSGLAEILYNIGHKIQGSDQNCNENIIRLENKGIKIFIGHNYNNIKNTNIVVFSSAIKKDNIEYIAAKKQKIILIKRSKMLAALMKFKNTIAVSGTHGKTTTTSLIGQFLVKGGLDPTIISGGIINDYKTNVRIGKSNWMIVEADESDGTFLELPVDIAVITNIDKEHLDYYKTVKKIYNAFYLFVKNISFYGFCVICIDYKETQKLVKKFPNINIITYGFNPQSNIRIHNLRLKNHISYFDIIISDKNNKIKNIRNLSFSMPGIYNVYNVVASIAVAYGLNMNLDILTKDLKNFKGIKRRFTFVDSWNGIKIFDDYAHHPFAIKSVLLAAKSITDGKVITIVQPHRFTRLQYLFYEFSLCFNHADIVIISPVYGAGENSIKNIDSEALANSIKSYGHKNVYLINNYDEIAPLVLKLAKSGDNIIFLGAGTVTNWSYRLTKELKIREQNAKILSN